MKTRNMDTVELRNGIVMPQIGYGVYQVDPSECERCVSDALKVGYRMIDTAQAYHNEEGVGAAVANSGIPRNELFFLRPPRSGGREDVHGLALIRIPHREQRFFIPVIVLSMPRPASRSEAFLSSDNPHFGVLTTEPLGR